MFRQQHASKSSSSPRRNAHETDTETEPPTENPTSASAAVVASLDPVSNNPYSAIALSPGSSQFAVLSCKDTMRIVQVGPSGLHLLKSIITNPYFTEPKRNMATGPATGESLSLRSFAFGGGNQQQQQPQPTSFMAQDVVNITDLAWSNRHQQGESSYIAVAGTSGTILVWAAEALVESAVAHSPQSRSNNVTTNPRGAPTSTGLPVAPEAMLHQHTRAVNRLAWHPTRRLLLSASQDGTAVLWETVLLVNNPQQQQQQQRAKMFPFFSGRTETSRTQYTWKRKATFWTKGDEIHDVSWSPHHVDGA